MNFLLLGLLGTAFLGATVFDWFDDDDNEEKGDDSPEETGKELGFDGSELLEGTEGDDTLPAPQDESLAPDTIGLLGGNDTATVDVMDVITVKGGDGEDSLTASGVLNTLEGGGRKRYAHS